MRKLPTVVLGLALAAALASCASERVKAANKAAKEDSKEYVDYYPTGSNIPVKVRKDQLKTSDQRTEGDQKALADAQTMGARPNKDPNGPGNP